MDLNSDRNMKVKGQESQQLFTTIHRTSLNHNPQTNAWNKMLNSLVFPPPPLPSLPHTVSAWVEHETADQSQKAGRGTEAD